MPGIATDPPVSDVSAVLPSGRLRCAAWRVCAFLVAALLMAAPLHAARIESGIAYFGRVLPGGHFSEGSTLDRVYGMPVTVTLTDFRPSLLFRVGAVRCGPGRTGFCFSLLVHNAAGDLLDRIDGLGAAGVVASGGVPRAILMEDPDFEGFGMVVVMPRQPDPVMGGNGSHALTFAATPFRQVEANAVILAQHGLGRSADRGAEPPQAPTDMRVEPGELPVAPISPPP